MKNIQFSIVTVTYNSSQTLKDTIESVLNQTYKNYEYLIVDGGSTDNTIEIVKSYEDAFAGRMKWSSEKDKGIYDAMNKGFQKATGDVLMLINSDDLFARPDALELVAQKFAENPDADCVYADLYYVSADNTDKIVRTWRTGEQKPFKVGWLPAHPTFYVKSDFYKKHGYFNLKYRLSADFELMLRFVEKYQLKMVYLPEHLVKMRLGGATSKNIQNIIKQNRECLTAFKDNGLKAGPFYLLHRMLPKIKQFFK